MMPMRGLSSFLARSCRSCLARRGELATVPRSAGGGLTLSGRLDVAAASTKACAGGEIGLSRIPMTSLSDLFSGSPGKTLVTSVPPNVLATRSLHAPAACMVRDGVLSRVPKATSTSHISPFGVKFLPSSFPSNMSSIRAFYTQQVGAPSSITGSSSFPANMSAIRGFYTQPVVALQRIAGFAILFGLVGIYGGVYLIELAFRPDVKPEPEEQGIDWVKLGCTPPVVPEQINTDCGCCYAIVSVQNLHSVLLIEAGMSPFFSIQEVIDCCGEDPKGRLYGCEGGFMSVAFDYMKKNGLASALDYPINLVQRQGPCQAAVKPRALQPVDKPISEVQAAGKPTSVFQAVGKPTSEVHVIGWEQFRSVQVIDWDQFLGTDDYKNRLRTVPAIPVEEQFKIALLKSPISVRFHSNDFFYNFRGDDIIEYHQCPPPPEDVGCNHGVLLVGFGTDKLGNKFWLIQNVWGVRWGNNGYARVRRGVRDPRGVGGITASFASRPVVKLSS